MLHQANQNLDPAFLLLLGAAEKAATAILLAQHDVHFLSSASLIVLQRWHCHSSSISSGSAADTEALSGDFGFSMHSKMESAEAVSCVGFLCSSFSNFRSVLTSVRDAAGSSCTLIRRQMKAYENSNAGKMVNVRTKGMYVSERDAIQTLPSLHQQEK